MPAEKEILQSLSRIVDPDFQKDIVSLGFVKNVAVQGDAVSLDIELTTPACPVKETFHSEAESILKGLGFHQVEVRMTSRAPRQLQKSTRLQKVRTILAVASCKGGVGKSTTAALIARELARRGHPTGLLDADIYGPSVPSLFGIQDPDLTMTEDKLLKPYLVSPNFKVMSFGFLLGDSPAILRGPMVAGYVQQLLHQVDWGELDYLVIDMPPGTGDVQLTITQNVELSGAVIVTTHQALSLVDVAKGILMFERVNVPILGLIENMSYIECEKCGNRTYPFGKPTASLQERFGVETLAEFPITPDFSEKFLEANESAVVSHAVDRIARSLGKRLLEPGSQPEIENAKDKITFRFADKKTVAVPPRKLRLSCACALCVDERTGKKILQESQVPESIHALEVTPIGNYAVGIRWSDGHSSGIYPYKMIREMS